jgi:hypothetical protein
MSDDMDIPAFLRIPQEVRKAAWERNPPKAAQSFSGRELTETEKAYRASKEYDKALRRERDRPRFEAMRAKAAAAKAELDAVKHAVRLQSSKISSKVRKS